MVAHSTFTLDKVTTSSQTNLEPSSQVRLLFICVFLDLRVQIQTVTLAFIKGSGPAVFTR